MHWFWDQWLEYKRSVSGKKPSQQDFMTKTGLAKNSMTSWKRGTMPTIGNFEAACNALGYRLTVVPKDDEDAP